MSRLIYIYIICLFVLRTAETIVRAFCNLYSPLALFFAGRNIGFHFPRRGGGVSEGVWAVVGGANNALFSYVFD